MCIHLSIAVWKHQVERHTVKKKFHSLIRFICWNCETFTFLHVCFYFFKLKPFVVYILKIKLLWNKNLQKEKNSKKFKAAAAEIFTFLAAVNRNDWSCIFKVVGLHCSGILGNVVWIQMSEFVSLCKLKGFRHLQLSQLDHGSFPVFSWGKKNSQYCNTAHLTTYYTELYSGVILRPIFVKYSDVEHG